MYQLLANEDDLKDFLDIEELPDGTARLLKRASELITQACFNNLDLSKSDHEEATKLATCAQVEYWLQLGEMFAFVNGVRSLAIGTFSIEFGMPSAIEDSMDRGQLSNRSRNFLFRAGLLYRGV